MRGAAEQVLVCWDQNIDCVPWNALADNDTVVNAGTAVSVALLFYIPWVTVMDSESSKRGRTLFSASGMPVATLGEKKNEVITHL